MPRGVRVRPTADRVREALFDILGATVRGARVLDAYAGSGALGFEALSRGARQAVFLESDRRAWLALRANAATLRMGERCTILRGRSVELLRGAAVRGPFDLVLADPPYASDEAVAFLPLAAGLLAADGGRIVIERGSGSDSLVAASSGLVHYRTASYGRGRLDFFRPSASGPAPPGGG